MANEIKLPQSVIQAVSEGKVIAYGEFRRGFHHEFTAKGGRVFHQSKSTVETPTGTFTVTEFLPDNTDFAKWAPAVQKGTNVFVIVREVKEESGVQIISGKIVPAI